MNEVVDQLKSPVFWFSTVIVGLILNLGTSYLKPWLDEVAGRYSLQRRQRNAANKAVYQMDIERMAMDNDYLQFKFQMELRTRVAAVLMLLMLVLWTVLFSSVVSLLLHGPRIQRVTLTASMIAIAIMFGIGFIASMKEARVLSHKLRAAFGLRWHVHNEPWADEYDLLGLRSKKRGGGDDQAVPTS